MISKISLAALLGATLAGSSKENAGPFIGETWESGLIDLN